MRGKLFNSNDKIIDLVLDSLKMIRPFVCDIVDETGNPIDYSNRLDDAIRNAINMVHELNMANIKLGDDFYKKKQ